MVLSSENGVVMSDFEGLMAFFLRFAVENSRRGGLCPPEADAKNHTPPPYAFL